MVDKINFIKEKLNDNEACIITSELHNYYLTGFKSTDGAFIIDKKDAYLLVDSRYIEAAEKSVKHCTVVGFNKLFDSIKDVLKKDGANKIFFERTHMTLTECDLYKSKLGDDFNLVFDETLDNLLLGLRLCKTDTEVEKIQKAQDITEEAMLSTLEKLYDGMTEREFALELEFAMKRLGAEEVSFDLITISGEKTSMPHGEPDNSPIKFNSFFTMDIGAVYMGYHSDMTRTVALGDVTDKMREVYNVVLEAQLVALSKIKAGVKCSDIDKAARDVITEAGYGEFFRHSTGHGVGIQIHEQPGVSPLCDTELKEGMVITIEPGIYLPGEFGVRIEDIVKVTKDGYYNFTKLPKELLVI